MLIVTARICFSSCMENAASNATSPYLAPTTQVKAYRREQERKVVRTLPAAINKLRLSAVTQGANSSSGCGDVIYDAFRFIDSDNSGMLSVKELVDGFAALGVNLSKEVADEVFQVRVVVRILLCLSFSYGLSLTQVFDIDGSGAIEYSEFVKTLFPARVN